MDPHTLDFLHCLARHGPDLERRARNLAGAEADELLQRTRIRGWLRRGQRRGNFRPWLRRIMARLWLDMRRSEAARAQALANCGPRATEVPPADGSDPLSATHAGPRLAAMLCRAGRPGLARVLLAGGPVGYDPVPWARAAGISRNALRQSLLRVRRWCEENGVTPGDFLT